MEVDCGSSVGDSEPPAVLRYRQRLEKSSGGEVVLMEWSPTMDLLAMALADHSVVLNRLSWQRVWTVGPGSAAITAIAWRPDGKVLAVGHTDGSVSLHDVENGQTLNSFTSTSAAAIVSLHWAALEKETAKEYAYEEAWSQCLPSLPSVENREEVYPEDPKKLQPSDALKSLHLLLIGDTSGQVHVCLLGIFLIAILHSESQSRGQVSLCWMSHDFKAVSNVWLRPSGVTFQMSGTGLLASKSCELQHMAISFGRISCYVEYMSATLKAMFEAWDDLLFNLDSQLAGYSKNLPEGRSVGDEFLVLLACGKASETLRDFLISELTAKGVKKLGLSLEHSYDNIRKFLLHHFHSSLQSLHLHLTGVLGMARWTHQFGELGLCESAVQGCINLAGTLALKSQEMLQAIDHSLQSIKVFFLWLYVVILKLSKETIPKGLKEDLTPEELKLIIDFLKKRLTKAKGGKHAFNLETVGQYLSNEDLKYVEERPSSFWEQLMESSNLTAPASGGMDHASDSAPSASVPWLFHPSPKKSLVQLFEMLHSSINEAFTTPMASVGETITSQHTSDFPTGLAGVSTEQIRPLTCHFVHCDTCFICLPRGMETVELGKGKTTQVCRNVAVFCYPRERGKGCFRRCLLLIKSVEGLPEKPKEQICNILSLRFYNEDSLSVLFQYSFEAPKDPTFSDTSTMVTVSHSVVAQLPIEGVASLLESESNDVGPMLTQVHNLGSFKAGDLAVSGTRKVAAIVSGNGKKVRVFDVDTEEECEE